MRRIERLLDRLAWLLLIAAAVAILAMMLNITADILGKLLFHRPVIGTLELVSSWYMVAVTFLPLAHVYATRSNIVVELFTQNLAAGPRTALDALGAALGGLYLGLLTWKGAEQAWYQTQRGEVADATFFEIPVWPTRWFLVAGCGVAALIAICQMLDDARFAATGRRWDERDAHRLSL